MGGRVAVVTDSTAYLPDRAGRRAVGVGSCPLQVVHRRRVRRRGQRGHAGAGRGGAAPPGRPVSTSRPTPAAFAAAYRDALDGGAYAVVSVHLSARAVRHLDSARLAAARGRRRCRSAVVDSRSVGDGPRLRRAGRRRGRAAGGGRERGRRGGRGHARERDHDAVLRRHAGVPAPRRPDRRGARRCSARRWRSSRCCTSPTAGSCRWRRCAPRAQGASPGWRSSRSRPPATRPVDVAVHHLAAADAGGAARRAAAAAAAAARRSSYVVEVGAVVGAHVGPGMLAVVVVRH